MTYSLGIIGAGNMAEAIARGILQSKLLQPHQIIAADPSPQRRDLFTDQLKIRTVEDNLQVASQSQTLFLSVKPQQMQEVLGTLAPVLSDKTLLISIAAGISTRFIEQSLPSDKQWRVIRSMPNTPMLVGLGMVAITPGQFASPADLTTARQIFESAAKVIDVPEPQIDAVTALSGSGPAYVYYLVESMIQAGIELGLSPEHAQTLAIQTALGAAKLLSTSPDSPAQLRQKVTSPGGTTQAALSHMASQNLPTIIVDALKAAASRSKELGK